VRTACLLAPDLCLVAALRSHPELIGRPLAVASGAGARRELLSVSPEALRCGVSRGQTPAQAQTLCAELAVCSASPTAEQAARHALRDAALAFSPRAALAPPASGLLAREAAVYLDASGITALFRSEAGFAAALGARAQQLGLPAAVAVASSRRVAHIAARLAAAPSEGQTARGVPTRIVPPGGETHFLAPLAPELCDPEDPLGETLTRLGLHRLGDLLALPRRALATRLGPRALEWVALLRGEAVEPPLPRVASRRLVEAIDLEHPIDHLQPLRFVLQGLLSRLLARLEARRLGCGDLVIQLDLVSGAREARRSGVAAASLDLRVLLRLASHSLEAQPPRAAVATLHLETEGRALRRDQLDLFRPAGPAPAALDQTLAELESLCGAQRVGAPVAPDALHPSAFAMAPFAPPPRHTAPRAEGAATPGFTATLALRALRPPVPARVRLHQHRPVWIDSAVAHGRVVRLAGPWRTTGGWWSREDRFAFDSFDIQTESGSVARLRLDHVRRSWQIDAVYD
jgi:protein ImuB